MRIVLVLLSVTGVLIAPLSAQAALNFDFSFTGTDGTVPGTVTGEVFGLTDNATSSPTDVVITGYPAAITGLLPAPWDLFTVPGYEFGENGLEDHFTVSGGAVTNAAFGEFTAADQTILDLGYGGLDVFANGPDVVADRPDAVFTPAPSMSGGVPEPEAWSLMLAGFGLASASLRARRRADLDLDAFAARSSS